VRQSAKPLTKALSCGRLSSECQSVFEMPERLVDEGDQVAVTVFRPVELGGDYDSEYGAGQCLHCEVVAVPAGTFGDDIGDRPGAPNRAGRP
jgi:hypothetical protein